MEEPRVQVRSEDGGVFFYDTIAEAMAHGERDSSAWKISWTDATGERVRLVREYLAWIYEPLEVVKVWGYDPRRLGDVK